MAKVANRKGVSNATRRRDLTAVSSVLRFAVSQGWRDDNPAKEWDRSVIRERRDPFSAKPFVQFYTKKRVGGDVVNFDAIKLFKIAAS